MPQYERDTWYDLHGHILFTNRKCLVGSAGRARAVSCNSKRATCNAIHYVVRRLVTFTWESYP
jgi:hypothetical protein